MVVLPMTVVLSLDQQLAACLTFEAYRFAGQVGLIGKPSRGSELAQLDALMLGTGAQRQKPLKAKNPVQGLRRQAGCLLEWESVREGSHCLASEAVLAVVELLDLDGTCR